MMDSGFAILARRLILAVPTFIVVSLLVFVVLRLLPADPVAMSLPPNATRAELVAARHDMGLDRPIPVQYAIWLGQVARGDLGTSIQSRRKVADLIVEALPTTLELVASGLALGIALGVGFGLAMFAWRGTAAEHAADLASIAVMSLPEFLWAILLILGLGVGLGWLPFIGRIDPQMRVAPVTGLLLVDTLVAGKVAAFLSALAHLTLPALSLALALPPLSLIGVQAGFMFGGTLLVEVIYTLPGLGNLMVQALRSHDLPLIQGIALVYCVLVLAINTTVDIAYLGLNPR